MIFFFVSMWKCQTLATARTELGSVKQGLKEIEKINLNNEIVTWISNVIKNFELNLLTFYIKHDIGIIVV